MRTKVSEKTSLEANIFFNQSTAILGFNSEFEITICNRSFSKEANIDPAEIKGENLFSAFKFSSSSDEIRNIISAGEELTCIINLDQSRFEVTILPLWGDEVIIGGTLTLGEEVVGNAKLNFLSKTGFKSVIEKAPMTIMIFRENGSVFYTNQHYKELWELSDRELYLIHEYYNVFEDAQLNSQAIGPYLKKAFQGKTVELPVVEYVLDYSGLGRKENTLKANWLLGYFFPMENPDSNENLVALIFTEITRQVEAEQAFKVSQERLELALEGGELGIWDWSLENNTIVYNRQWAKILGYEVDELDVNSWKDLVHPEDFSWVEKELNDHIQGKSDTYLAEYRVLSKSGDWKWILDRGKAVEFSSTGKAKRISGTHLDITATKQNEEVLKNSEARYRSLIENLPTGVAIVQDDEVVYANPELHSILKSNVENELIGQTASECFTDTSSYNKRVNNILNTNTPEPTKEVEIKDLQGNKRCVEITSIPFIFNDRPAVQSIVNDVEDRREVEKQTQKAEKLLSQLFENAPMGIVMLGFDDEILKINKGFEQIFGFNSDEVVGKYIDDIIVPQDLKEEGIGLSVESGKGDMVYCESIRSSKSNEHVPVMIYTLPVIHEEQRLGVYGIYVDLRQRVKIEEELKVRNLELDNFVYKVSHDLRSPLASILGLINLVKLEGGFQDSMEYLKLMENQVHKLDDFIHDVLSHSKNLKMSLISAPIDFNEIINKCVSDLSYLKGFDKVVKSISVNAEGFLSDNWRINEIFRNLIANSIKYKDGRKDYCELDISVQLIEDTCEIKISDNGIGIPKESIPHIFEMFYRATETSTGSGIGLYIVKNAVEKLNGTIRIESEHRVGTSFIMNIPTLKN